MKRGSLSYLLIVCVLFSFSMYGCAPLLLGVAIGGVGHLCGGKRYSARRHYAVI